MKHVPPTHPETFADVSASSTEIGLVSGFPPTTRTRKLNASNTNPTVDADETRVATQGGINVSYESS